MALQKSIVIDASSLITVGLNDKIIKLIVGHNKHIIFYVTRKSLIEFKRYYENKNTTKFENFLNYFLSIINNNIIEDDELASFEHEARVRIARRDADDWQEVALALKLNCAILTEDKDFLSIGIATWRLDTIGLLTDTREW